ncbi:MAG: hypothetical protein HQK86_03120 [Nitrospinae bacterium]|nr:hypothetical protein [Nitrospinota bacterium]
MQTLGDHRDRRGGSIGRLVLTILISVSLAAPVNAEPVADPGKKPIPFNKNLALAKKYPILASVLKSEPSMHRDWLLEAPIRVVKYFAARPEFASRLMAEYDQISGPLEKDEDGNGWMFRGVSGAQYVFRAHGGARENVYFAKFTYFHSSSLAPQLKISGSGAVVVSISSGKDTDTTTMDYDIYFTEGGEPLDKVAVSASIHMAEIINDVASFMEAFATMCGNVNDDPESVADDMRDADDVFTKKEIGDFESAMGVKRRWKGR